jgi:rare lipoprotein A
VFIRCCPAYPARRWNRLRPVVALALSRCVRGKRSRRGSARGVALVVCGALLLAGCDLGGSGSGWREESKKLGPRVVELGQPVPKGGGMYKVGSPYRLNGRLYVPQEVRGYDKQGIASWYGEMFHGRRTANGEIYDMEALTAAHPTLPLPSLARVTNLENARSLVVRVNDRGPYAGGRAIDLSWAVASLLQVRVAGTARVRIQYLGPAPLNGDDSYERQVLARQQWAGPQVGFAASPAKAMRRQRSASAPGRTYSDASARTGQAPAVSVASLGAARPDFDTSPVWPAAEAEPRQADSLRPPRNGLAQARWRAPAGREAPATAQAPRPRAAPARADLRERERATTQNPAAKPPPNWDSAAAAQAAQSNRSRRQRSAQAAARSRNRQQPAFIEAGLFPDQRVAQRLAATLTDLAPVALEPELVSGATMHRLRVGPFASQTDAEAAVMRMRAAGLSGAYVQPVPGG